MMEKYCRFLENCSSQKDMIGYLLFSYPLLRDNDGLLFWNVWVLSNTTKDEQEAIRKSDETKNEYKLRFANDITGNRFVTETIRRTRQRFQETYPELRGKTYVKRQEEGKKVTNSIQTQLSV